MIRKVLEMTDINEIREAHKIVDRIYTSRRRNIVRKFLPPRPEPTFRETIDALNALVPESDVHVSRLIDRLDRLEKSYSATPVVESEALPFKDVPATEPADPEFLETEADYEKAPEGTIVAKDDISTVWIKRCGAWKSTDGDRGVRCPIVSYGARRVLRRGWGDDD